MVWKHKDLTALVNETISDHKKLKDIISLLYDEDMEQRFVAAKALGEIARIEPDIIKQRWDRIFYAFDDTMSCWGAAEGLGEIGRNIPEMRSKIVLFLRKFQRDECSCQGFIWAICRIGQVDMKMIQDSIPDLINFLESENACIVAQTIWALGELGIKKAAGKIKSFLNDNRETWLYENDSARIRTIGETAADAVRKLQA